MDMSLTTKIIAAIIVLQAMAAPSAEAAPDAGFTAFIASLWPEAQAAGVSRATFDAETKSLEPDYKLPDLILPGRPATGAPSQAEFVQVPADYIKEASIARLAEEGQRLMAKYRSALTAIEARFGVPATIVLAIWGRETDFGRYTLPYDELRVLATQAYVGRRKDTYRNEFILALKMIGDGEVTRRDMRGSWAGATGLTQFLPSEFYKHGVDFDGDGRKDIWHSVPDALASAAQQLVNKGWQPGVRWAYEVRAPANVDCTQGVPEVTKPIGEWLRAGFVPVRGEKLSATEQAQPASLLQPEGIYGPAFLTTKNYFVIKEYNFSDLYVLYVGHLSDRMLSPQAFATPWSASTQLRTADVEAMQRHLTRIGLYKDKVDGKAGMQTRAALGAYQKSAGLKVDCWPSEAVLRSISAAR
jgi:lytic murein transglycosylase